jgi:hypothetical protein
MATYRVARVGTAARATGVRHTEEVMQAILEGLNHWVDEQGQGVRQREKVRQRDRPARGCTGSSLNALTTPMYFTRRREQRAGSAQQRALGAFVPPPLLRGGVLL